MRPYAKYVVLLLLVGLAIMLWSPRIADRETGGEPAESLQTLVPHGLEAFVDDGTGETAPATRPDSEWANAEGSGHRENGTAASRDHNRQDREEQPRTEPTATDTVNGILKSRDLGQAFAAYTTLQQCRHAPITDQDLQHQLAKIETLRNDPEHGWELSQHLQGAEERKLAQLEQCRALMRLREKIWASELFDRALSGDEFARFIYAMWAPRELATLEASTEELQAYESMALEFTMQNLEEGHPLGLLALGFSYQQGRYFTPSRHVLGNAYLIAAELCTNGQFGLQEMLDSLLESMEEHQFGASPFSTAEVLAAGTRLYDTHCATSIANSPP